jgi:hypothetical protein
MHLLRGGKRAGATATQIQSAYASTPHASRAACRFAPWCAAWDGAFSPADDISPARPSSSRPPSPVCLLLAPPRPHAHALLHNRLA